MNIADRIVSGASGELERIEAKRFLFKATGEGYALSLPYEQVLRMGGERV